MNLLKSVCDKDTVQNRQDMIRLSERELRMRDILLFSFLIGALATLVGVYRYRFGFGNQLETLPSVFRALDPSFAVNDYFVNTYDAFNPRYYYVLMIAGLARVLPLPWLFLILTCLAHVGVVFVTYLTSRRLFNGSALAAMLACALVMAIDGTDIGAAAKLKSSYLEPHMLALPLALFAVASGIFMRPFTALGAACLSSFIHPLVGVESGAIALASTGLAVVLGLDERNRSAPIREQFRALASAMTAGALFGFFVLFVWLIPSRNVAVDSASLFDFLHFRASGHFIPSTFGLSAYVNFACFLASLALSWSWWRRNPDTSRSEALRFLMPIGLVLVGLVGGYVFVEVIPSPVWASAHTFRLIFIIKWLGFLLFANTIARLLTDQHDRGSALTGWMMLLGNGPIQPFFLLMAHGAEAVRRVLGSRVGWNVGRLAAGGLFLLYFGELVHWGIWGEWYSVILFTLISFWFFLLPPKWYRNALPLAGLALLLCLLTINQQHRIPYLSQILDKRQPILTLAQGGEPGDVVAEFAREHTPQDAVFLTPPNLGRFRLVARRAIVVDFKIAGTSRIAEWLTRWRDCYEVMPERADSVYAGISEQRILSIAEKYGTSYAVLYEQTPCSFPVLFSDGHFKLVEIPGSKNSVVQ